MLSVVCFALAAVCFAICAMINAALDKAALSVIYFVLAAVNVYMAFVTYGDLVK